MGERAELSAEQEAAVHCAPGGGHVLIVARPGSGKTFTLVARARHLLESGLEPERLLAMTFSRRAAASLQDRLGRTGIQAGTFHAICADMLERDGAPIGIRAPIRIVDERRAREFLVHALTHSGVPLPQDERARQRHLAALAARIDRRKRRGLTEHRVEPAYSKLELFDVDVLNRVDDRYCRMLREANAFDFADLVAEAVRLLREDAGTAERRRNGLSVLLVDEFHDISPEQYALIQLLAPPHGEGEVFAVGDLDQAIFGWRDANASDHFQRFRREYHPREFSLTINFRSRQPIVRAADRCMAAAGRSRPSQPRRGGKAKPMWWQVCDAEHEARLIASLIRSAMDSGRVGSLGSFAVLYRTHHIGDAIEAELIRTGIPLWRVQDDRFFDREDARESLRYLELGFYLADADLVPVLNWPRAIVDELTMARLRRMAARRGIGLDRLIRSADQFADEISPLTRHALRDVVAIAARDLQPLTGVSMREALEPFLAILAGRRSPVAAAKREELRDTCQLLVGPLMPLLSALHAAITRGEPIRLTPAGDADGVAAAMLFTHVLQEYFGISVSCNNNEVVFESRFDVVFGDTLTAAPSGITIGAVATRTVTFSVATVTWRLLQLVLMACESRGFDRVVAFDIESSSIDPRHAEIVEYAAIALAEDGAPGESVTGLVQPSHPDAIDRRASDMHGLRWRDLSGAPRPEDCLPRLLSHLDDAVVVGHNLDEFDLPVLRRVADRVGLAMVPLYSIDTRRMAQRLWPGEVSYRLEDLARRIDPRATQTHRAHDDCLLAIELFRELHATSLREREIDVLPEALPLIAAATLASHHDVVYDNTLLVETGARALAQGIGHSLLSRWRDAVGEDVGAAVCAALREWPASAPEEDARWQELEAGWRAVVAAYELTSPGGGIAAFLRHVALAQPIDALPRTGSIPDGAESAAAGREERVQLMTVHSAKGLEWDIVFLAGVEDDLFPHYRASTDEAVAEERRVLYVAMTRARNLLFLFSAAARHGWVKRPSRFLESLLGDSIEIRDGPSPAAATSSGPDGRMA
ncbi:MAG: UvrD-helicase domain-containing protein [Thermomicrobiales bacterium]